MQNRPQIAVVEDSEQVRELVAAVLDNAGYRCVSFSNGQSALQELPNQKPDIVILDVMLPDIDGFQICREIMSTKDYSPIVYFLTGKNSQEDIEKGIQLGAVDYITKPIDAQDLLLRITQGEDRIKAERSGYSDLNIATHCLVGPEKFEVSITGISALGVLLSSPMPIDELRHIALDSDALSSVVKLEDPPQFRVLTCEDSKDRFEITAEFVGMSSADSQTLNSYLEQLD